MMRELALFGLMFVAVLLTLGVIVGWGKLVEHRAAVRTLRSGDADVMSNDRDDGPAHVPSSLQTDDRRTPDRPTMLVPTPAQMLDIFRVLRAAGVKRDALQGAWRAAGLKLDNNLWTQAAPPPAEEPPTVTPIAGRPTNAKFHDDPELEYQPLR